MSQQNAFFRRMNALFELKKCILPAKECIPSANRSHSVTPHGPFFRQINAFCQVKQRSMCPQTMGDVGSKNGHFSPPSPALQAERAGHVTSKAPSFALQLTTLLAQRTHTSIRNGAILGPTCGAGMPRIPGSSSAKSPSFSSMHRRLQPGHRSLRPRLPRTFPARAAGNDTDSPAVRAAPHAPPRCLGGSCD